MLSINVFKTSLAFAHSTFEDNFLCLVRTSSVHNMPASSLLLSLRDVLSEQNQGPRTDEGGKALEFTDSLQSKISLKIRSINVAFNLPDEQQITSHSRQFTALNDSGSIYKPKNRSISVNFLAVVLAPGVGKFNFIKI